MICKKLDIDTVEVILKSSSNRACLNYLFDLTMVPTKPDPTLGRCI